MGAVLAMGGVGILRGDPLRYAWAFRRHQLRRHARQGFYKGLSYFVGGEGKPVVFVHGFSDHAGSWADTVAMLSEQCRVIAIELPGHGDSVDPLSDDFETLYAGFEALLDLLVPRHEKAILIGNSMGGWLALKDALKHPERTDHLILLNSAGLAYEIERDLLMPQTREQMHNKLLAILGPKRMPAVMPGAFLDALMGLTTPYYQRLYDTITEDDFLDDDLHKVDVPITVLWGELDRILPPDYASQFLRALPNHTKVIAQRHWAHSAQMSHPEQLTQQLEYIIAPYTRSHG